MLKSLSPLLPLLSAAMLLSAPAHATDAPENAAEAWTVTQDAIRVDAAGIALPQTIAGLSLTKSGEASNGGRAVDNYAQYLSEDGAVQATLYVYMPTYADAALAAHMTDKAIMERFGDRTRRTAYAATAVGSLPGRAIRAVYDDAADGALTTAAGFVHAGRWVVKIRVTGPTDRRDDVVAGLDGMLAGLTVDDPATLHATTPVRLGACPAAMSGRNARLVRSGSPDALSQPAAVEIPHDGQDALCVRGTVAAADGRYDILQQMGRDDGPIIVPVNDSGTVLAFSRGAQDAGYRLSIHMVGRTDLYGAYDALPSATQVAAILDGKDPHTASAEATAAYSSDGRVTVSRLARADR